MECIFISESFEICDKFSDIFFEIEIFCIIDIDNCLENNVSIIYEIVVIDYDTQSNILRIKITF